MLNRTQHRLVWVYTCQNANTVGNLRSRLIFIFFRWSLKTQNAFSDVMHTYTIGRVCSIHIARMLAKSHNKCVRLLS